jgi:perosamine synthetase
MTEAAASPPTRLIPLVEPWLGEDCAEAVRDQVLTSFVGPGAACKAFADGLARLTGVLHCALTTSGTVALSVAAHTLGLRAGDEILVPAYGVISTINAFASMGLRPRLVDVDPRTGCIAAAEVERRLTSRTKAVCYVNFAGCTGTDLLEIAELCETKNIPLIEDAAQAIGQRHEGRSAGSFGRIGTLSFSPPKILTTGQGGAIFTADQRLADEVAKYIDHGDLSWRQTNLNREIGTNLRFNDVLAALGLAQLRTLDVRLARKRELFDALRARLNDKIFVIPGNEAPFYFIVFADDPDAVVARLRSRAIMAQRHGRALYEHPAYAELHEEDFPGAAYWTEHAVYLPFGLAMTVADAERIGTEVHSIGAILPRP